MAEETVILHFEVDQGAAERKLEKIEALLLDNKKAQTELSAAYKKGVISQEEYVKENIRLQQNIKKEQDQKKALIKTIETESNSRNSLRQRIGSLVKEYDNLNIKTTEGAKRADALQKELAQLNDQLNKGSKSAGLFKDNIGKYPDAFGPAIQNIRIAGTSVGDLGTKLAAFANPATAAVGIVGALAGAYAKSTIGAKDLEFAHNQLTTAFNISSNAFASFISSTEDGEGIVSSFIDNVLNRISPALAVVSKVGASLQEEMQDLGRLESEIRVNAYQLIEENQELLEKISDDQTKLNDKLIAADVIEKNLVINKKNILDVLNSQLSNLQNQLALDKENETLQNSVLNKRQEISKEAAALEKQLTRINKTQDDLNNKLREQLALDQAIFELDTREANAPPVSLTPVTPNAAGDIDDPVIAASKARTDQYLAEVKVVEQTEEQKRAAKQQSLEFEKAVDAARLNAAHIIFNALGQLADEGSAEQKALALISIGISTAKAIAGAVAASQDIPYPGNLVAMATSIATVLSNIASAKNIIDGFYDGGYTPSSGNDKDAVGAVHANEYVAPARVVRSPAAQPHLDALERMRGGYYDGGFTANQVAAPAQQALILANALKSLPRPIVDVREVTKAQDRIGVRENAARL